MDIQTPDGTIALFNDRLNAGDLEGLLALYEPSAAFVSQAGEVVAGASNIHDALSAFLALKPVIAGTTLQMVEADDIALISNKWELRGIQPDGTPVGMKGVSADVLRRQPDGTWQILIDSPWGGSTPG
jgi:ketosteroid isomerase-like protein